MSDPQFEIFLRHEGSILTRICLPQGEYLIGRDEQADIYVETPQLSRRHARLTLHADHYFLEDLGSSNGTFLKEERLSQPMRLLPHQTARLGRDILLEVQPVRSPTEAPQSTLARHLEADQRYAIGAQIAQGGMGAILQARQCAVDRTVAMKVMHDTIDEAHVLRFINEAKITGQLDHPNIVPIIEIGLNEIGQPFYTMKIVQGDTLHQVLHSLAQGFPEDLKKYPLPVLLTIFQKVCDALAFAHSKGVIHRDLKPENIMLGDFGSVLVMDWGLAKFVRHAPPGAKVPAPNAPAQGNANHSAHASEPVYGSTLAGSIMGTPAYMSPEQARGEVDTLDARSDIYSLGLILFELLHLRPAYTGKDAWDIVDKVAKGEIWSAAAERSADAAFPPSRPCAPRPAKAPSPLRSAGALQKAPDSLLAILRKALALNPAKRYPTVEALQADLLAYQNGFATSAEKAGAWKQFTLLVKRNKAAAGGIAAVLLVGIGFGTNAFLAGRRAERAVTDLRAAIPTFIEQAQTLVGQQRSDEAITKLDFALTIDERDATVLQLRGDYLQSALRLKDAAAVYRRVLALRPDARAKANLILCERLLSQYGDGALPDPALDQLWTALLAQKRDAEAVPLTVRLAKNKELLLPMIRSRLKTWNELPMWTVPGVDRVRSLLKNPC